MYINFVTYSVGSHSVESKKTKRNAKRRRKRLAYRARLSSDGHSSTSSEDVYISGHPGCTVEPSDIPTPPAQKSLAADPSIEESDLPSDYVHSGDRCMASTIDALVFENDEFWDKKIKKELREYERYRDVHPSILTDAARSVDVVIDGTGPHKGSAGFRREDYISRLHKRDEKGVRICQLLRDRIETLEDVIKDSKVQMMKVHRENKRKVEQVRYFWRSKIFEGNTRGGQMLMSAMVYPDMHH